MDEYLEVVSIPGFVAVTRSAVVSGRREIEEKLLELERELGEAVAGPPFFFIEFITEAVDGLDVRYGFPVVPDTVGSEHVGAMEVIESTCSSGDAPSVRNELFIHAYSAGLISDEFTMDSYPRWRESDRETVSVRFVIHSWYRLLFEALEKELGAAEASELRITLGEPLQDWSLDRRFDWTLSALEELSERLDEVQLYRVVSSCAHIFPSRMLERLKSTFARALEAGATELEAVDAVREYMRETPGWPDPPRREGTVLVSSKGPRDRAAFESAETPEARRRAACFCPVVREMMENGMPDAFCLCGAGWMRQQWEAVLGRPLRTRIRETMLRGDPRCTFSIDLAETMESGEG